MAHEGVDVMQLAQPWMFRSNILEALQKIDAGPPMPPYKENASTVLPPRPVVRRGRQRMHRFPGPGEAHPAPKVRILGRCPLCGQIGKHPRGHCNASDEVKEQWAKVGSMIVKYKQIARERSVQQASEA
jgi:hypothetical protein